MSKELATIQARRAGRDRPRGDLRGRARPLARCARPSASSSCATRCAGSRRRSARTRRRPPARPRRRSTCAACAWPRRDLAAARGRAGDAGGRAARAGRAGAGRAAPAEPHAEPLRFAAYAGGDEVLVGEAETLAAVAMGWGDRPLVTHDWKSIAAPEEPCATPPLEHDTLVAAYLIDPARPRATRSRSCSSDEGIGGDREERGRAGASARWSRVCWPSASASGSRSAGLTSLLREVELPLVRRADRHGAHRRQARRRRAWPRSPAGSRTRIARARARDLGAGGGGVHDRLAAAAVGDPLQQARPVEEAPRQDGLLHRRARAPGDPRRAPDRREDRGLARALEAQVDLPRRAAGADRREHRAPPHDVQPDRDHDRPPVEHEPEPPERADPHGARPRDPRRASWPRRGTS